jgi:hypothetical protein
MSGRKECREYPHCGRPGGRLSVCSTIVALITDLHMLAHAVAIFMYTGTHLHCKKTAIHGASRQIFRSGQPGKVVMHLIHSLTLSLLMSYIYGAPCKARNFNVIYMDLCLATLKAASFFTAKCFKIESMQKVFLGHSCV